METREEALLAAQAAGDKKANRVVVLDVHEVSGVADYFVICGATNTTQVRAIADAVEEKLGQVTKRGHREGYDVGHWVLLDYGAVVVHVLHETERAYYNLERLWGDAPVLPVAFA
ncbi:MAG: ribosome silencing factor [Symbiobacteriia bacterium]